MTGPCPFRFFPAEREILHTEPLLPTVEWARRNFVLLAGTRERQLWSPDGSPMAVEVMNDFDRPWVREQILVWPSRGQKTTTAYACAFSRTAQRAVRVAMGMPTEDGLKKQMVEKVHAHVLACPALRRKLASKGDLQTTQATFRDGYWRGMWSGSDTTMSGFPAEIILCDEEDDYATGADVDKMRERGDDYPYTRKLIRFSKPRGAEGQSSIYRGFESAQVRKRIEARCPACNTYQVMEFERIKIRYGETEPGRVLSDRLAYYECCECRCQWNDHMRDVAIERGRIVADKDVARPATIAYHLRTWETSRSLSRIMHDWLVVKSDPERRQNFVNNHHCKPYVPVITETDAAKVLARLAHTAVLPSIVPADAQVITLFADHQKSGLPYSVWAHRVDPVIHWQIEYGLLEDFEALKLMVCDTQFAREGKGERLSVWRAGIDTGGGRDRPDDESMTMQVYRWLLSIPPRRIYPTKGMSHRRPGEYVYFRDIDKTPQGKPLKGRLKLHFIDTHAFKLLLLDHHIKEGSSEPLWLHKDTGIEYVEQLLAEQLEQDPKTKKEKWVRRGENHWLDCAVGHLAMTSLQWRPSLHRYAHILARRHTSSQDARPEIQADAPKPSTGGGGLPTWLLNSNRR